MVSDNSVRPALIAGLIPDLSRDFEFMRQLLVFRVEANQDVFHLVDPGEQAHRTGLRMGV